MASNTGPMEPVSPPAPLPPSRSLLQALPPISMGPRGAGVAHVEGRAPFPLGPLDWCAPATVSIAPGCEHGQRTSFAVVAGELRANQSTFAFNRITLEERQASAQLNLELHESFVVARELMYGTASVANGWGNPYLTDPANLQIVTTALQPYRTALDRITKRWAILMHGERGLIHVSPSVARTLVNQFVVEQRGANLYDTVMGHQLVIDAGYAGADPDGATLADPSTAFDPYGQAEWIFMSPNIDIRESGITLLPSTPDEMAYAVDRANNNLQVVASRVFSYTYELPITGGSVPPVLGIPVDLCSADCIPGSS